MHRFDGIEPDVTQLAADAPNVGVEGAVGDVVVAGVGTLDQLARVKTTPGRSSSTRSRRNSVAVRLISSSSTMVRWRSTSIWTRPTRIAAGVFDGGAAGGAVRGRTRRRTALIRSPVREEKWFDR